MSWIRFLIHEVKYASSTAEDPVIVRDDDPRCAELEADGYRTVGESWGARLRLPEGADLSGLIGAVSRVAATGLVILEIGPESAEALFELEAKNNADYPFTPATFQAPPQRAAITALWREGKRVFGAFDGDRLVGAIVGAIQDGIGDNDFAAVLAEYRGSGPGAALAAASIIACANEEVREFTAGGAAIDDASLGLVRSTSFIVEEQWRSYQC